MPTLLLVLSTLNTLVPATLVTLKAVVEFTRGAMVNALEAPTVNLTAFEAS
jgi:hypothetical protein